MCVCERESTVCERDREHGERETAGVEREPEQKERDSMVRDREHVERECSQCLVAAGCDCGIWTQNESFTRSEHVNAHARASARSPLHRYIPHSLSKHLLFATFAVCWRHSTVGAHSSFRSIAHLRCSSCSAAGAHSVYHSHCLLEVKQWCSHCMLCGALYICLFLSLLLLHIKLSLADNGFVSGAPSSPSSTHLVLDAQHMYGSFTSETLRLFGQLGEAAGRAAAAFEPESCDPQQSAADANNTVRCRCCCCCCCHCHCHCLSVIFDSVCLRLTLPSMELNLGSSLRCALGNISIECDKQSDVLLQLESAELMLLQKSDDEWSQVPTTVATIRCAHSCSV